MQSSAMADSFKRQLEEAHETSNVICQIKCNINNNNNNNNVHLYYQFVLAQM